MSTYDRYQRLTRPGQPREATEVTQIDRLAVGHALIRMARARGFHRLPGTLNTARMFGEGYAVFGPNGELVSFTPYRELWI